MRRVGVEYMVEYAVTYGVLFVVGLVARIVGVKAVEEERMPRALWERWNEERGKWKV